jgi:hypothetical protein
MLRRLPAVLLASVAMVTSPLALATPPEPDPVAEPSAEPGTDLPAYDADLPSYDAPLLAAPDPRSVASEPPPDGNGAIVAGAIMLGGGATLGAISGVLLGQSGQDSAIWFSGAMLAVLCTVGLAPLTVGLIKRQRYKPWRLEHDAPARGTGMFVGGVMSLSAGTLAMLLGGISLGRQADDGLPYGEVLLGLGSASVLTGATLLAFGVRRRNAFDRWDHARVQLVPSAGLIANPSAGPAITLAGVSVGVAGRF